MRRLLHACLLTVLLLPAVATAGKSARDHLQAFIASADSYTAQFDQQLLDENGQEIETASGQFWLQRPGQFRWHYEPPMERLLVSDGEFIWLYDIDLDQVTKRAAGGEVEKTPAGILVGDESALDNYELSIREEREGYVEIGLRPSTARTDFEDIVIALDKGRITQLRLADRFAQVTVIRFTDVRVNPDVPADTFRLELPDYVDVIDQTASQVVE